MYSPQYSGRFRGGARSIASLLATSKNTKDSMYVAIDNNALKH